MSLGAARPANCRTKLTKLCITPIGTCRIHTPLKRASSRYPVELDLRRNYGFVHTSSEALQQLRFLQGDKQFQPQVAPLVFREADVASLKAQSWEPSDLHVVEISSAKHITSGDDAVQGNYVSHHFADFFASSERSRLFWALVKKGHRRELIEYLREQPAYRLLAQDDRELLASLSMQQQSFKAIKSDMAEIVERIGKDRLLFVTHVNATTTDGALIPTRDRVIRWVKLAANQLEVPVFDPTEEMQKFGQDRALEDGGRDLTHYTLAFSDRLYDRLHQSHIGSLIGARAGSGGPDEGGEQVAMLAAQLETMLEHGDFFATARELHDAVARMPDALPLIEVRGLIRSRIGDYNGALEDLKRRGDDTALSQPMRIGLLEALNATGDHQGALKVAENLIADEFETASIYRVAASAAERLEQKDTALSYAKQAFRKDRSDLSTALKALVLLTEHGSEAEVAEWRRELLENIGSSSSGAFEICMWAIKHRDEDLFTSALQAVAAADKTGTIDLVEEAFTAKMFKAVADAIPFLARIGRVDRGMADRRSTVLQGAAATSTRLFEQGRAAEAHYLAQGLVGLRDISNSQIARSALIREMRPLVRRIILHFRSAIRDAHRNGQAQKLLELGESAGDVLLEDPDTAVIVARALHSSGSDDQALALLKKVRAKAGPSFNVHRWAGRVAASAGDYETALEMYGSLDGFDNEPIETVKAEVKRFFGRVERRALKQLRELVDTGRHDEALRLADAIERHLGPLERTGRELMRMRRFLRLQLQEIDQGDGEMGDREPILRKLVRTSPGDKSTLRRLALELMRQFRFAEAAEYWERLHILDPSNVSADRNRVRCATLAQRRTSDLGIEVGTLG